MGAAEIFGIFILLWGGVELSKPRVPGAVQDELWRQVHFLLEHYNARHGLDIPMPALTFDFRDSNFYASSSLSKRRIRFNPAKVNSRYEHVYSITTRHELAHLIMRYRYGLGPMEHGEEWRTVFQDLGGNLAEAAEDRVLHGE